VKALLNIGNPDEIDQSGSKTDREIDLSSGQRSGDRSREESDCINPDCDGCYIPIGAGLAQSLAQPGGNVTGLTVMEPELDGKRFETLKPAVPDLKVGLMVSRVRDDSRQDSPRRRASEAVARSLNVSLEFGEFDVDTAQTAITAIAACGVFR
jgi:hypothetical protein